MSEALPRRRLLTFRALAMVLGLILLAVAGEVVVRLFFLRTPLGHPLPDRPGVFEYRYEIKKWSDYFSDSLDPSTPMHYQYYGLETDRSTFVAIRETDGGRRHFPFQKPSGTYRVVCLGDSLTEPWQDPGYRNYTHFLADALRRERPAERIEVIPVGVGGYNTWQEMHLFRENLQGLEMDLLILQMCSNDADVMSLEPRPAEEEQAWDEWPDYDLVARGHYRPDYRALGYSRLLWFLSRLPFHDRAGTQLHHCRLLEVNDEQRRALTWLRDWTHERGVDFLPVIFPVFYDGYSQPGPAYLRELLSELDIEHHDLTPYLERFDLVELAMPGDYYHPNPDGHGRASESLMAYLKATGRVAP